MVRWGDLRVLLPLFCLAPKIYAAERVRYPQNGDLLQKLGKHEPERAVWYPGTMKILNLNNSFLALFSY